MALDAITQRACDAWNLAKAALYDETLATGEDWRAVLAVYADALSSSGDVRGELIAFDLQRLAGITDPALEHARNAVLHQWLGPLAERPCIESRLGLVAANVTATDPDALDRVLESAAAGFVEIVQVCGDEFLVRRALERLASITHPWLSHLAVRLDDPRRRAAYSMLSERETEALLAALPNLSSLALDGNWIMAPIASTTLRHLEVSGWSALGSLRGRGEGIDSLVSVDFRFESSSLFGRKPAAPLSELFLRSFPALRQLDLSRDFPLNGPVDIFQFLRGLSVTTQLTHLRLPAIESSADARALQEVLDGMTRLQAMTVMRGYGDGPALVHPTAHLQIPSARPWFKRDSFDPASYFTVDLGAETHSLRIMFLPERPEARFITEMSFERLPSNGTGAWNVLWRTISKLFSSSAAPRRVPTDVLAGALAASSEFVLDPRWRVLARALAETDQVEVGMSNLGAARER